MKTQNTAEDIAAKRMLQIMPLLEEGIDHRRTVELRKQVATNHDISYRTITRYHDAYVKSGFEGLKQIGRASCRERV